MQLLFKGTKYRGDFEKRFIVLKAKQPILFIDEIHTVVVLDQLLGSMDVSCLTKPALANLDVDRNFSGTEAFLVISRRFKDFAMLTNRLLMNV